MDSIDNLIREVAALSSQRDAAFTAATAPVAGGAQNLLMTFPIGTPVLDLITGQQGVVIDGKRENVIIPPA
jgi:hypothetical protein